MSRKKTSKVMAAFIHYRGVPETFMRCFWASKGVDFQEYTSASSSRTNAARTANGQTFLDSDCDWIFYVDTDMVWEPGTIRELKKWAVTKGVKAVAGWAAMPKNGIWPNAFRLEGGGSYVPWGTIEPFSEPLKVDAVGGSCFLVHRSVLEKVKENYEGKTAYYWQEEPYVPGLNLNRGEDVEFSHRIREAGFDIWYHPGAPFVHMKTQQIGPAQFNQFLKQLHERLGNKEYSVDGSVD